MHHAAWPVDPAMIAPFLVAIILIELTPGPNMGYLAGLAALQGRRAGLVTVIGITCGLSAYMLAAVFGLTEVLRQNRGLYQLLRWSGVLYMVWMAYDAWREGEAEVDDGAASGSDWRHFQHGLLANLLNPKAALFYVTLLPGFIQPDHAAPATQALVLGSSHVLVSVVIHTTIVLLADRAGAVLRRASASRIVRGGFALSLLAMAAWLAVSTAG